MAAATNTVRKTTASSRGKAANLDRSSKKPASRVAHEGLKRMDSMKLDVRGRGDAVPRPAGVPARKFVV